MTSQTITELALSVENAASDLRKDSIILVGYASMHDLDEALRLVMHFNSHIESLQELIGEFESEVRRTIAVQVLS